MTFLKKGQIEKSSVNQEMICEKKETIYNKVLDL